MSGSLVCSSSRDSWPVLQACLNGSRQRHEHAALPISAAELGRDAARAVAAGAEALHVHVRGSDDRETLDPQEVAVTLDAIRVACPDIAVGISTGAWIVPEPAERLALVEQWSVVPDFASVNLGEAGSTELCEVLIDRGIGVEAGLWQADDAERLVDSRLAARCVRVLLEPQEATVDTALMTVVATEAVLDRAGVVVPRLLHGADETAWHLLDWAARRGYDTRIGLEDVLTLPDGRPAPGNADLVAAARALSAS